MIGIYTRVSTEGQRDQYSLPIQRESGINFANSKNLQYKIYEDVYTGKSVSRTGWKELLNDISNKKISILYIHAFDRLSRNTRDALDIIDLMRENDIKFYVNSTFYDIFDPNIEMILTINYAVATNEGKKISNRSLEGKHKEINSGMKRLSNPLGYTSKFTEDGNKLWVIDDKEAKTVQYIFDLFLEGFSLTKITRTLNYEGYTPKKAKFFEPSAVERVLKRIEYTGKTFNTDNEIIESRIYDAIIDFSKWKKVNDSYKTQITNTSQRIFGFGHLSSGLLRCGYCNQPYNYHQGITHNNIRKRYYHKSPRGGKLRQCKQRPKTIYMTFLDELFKCTYALAIKNKDFLIQHFKDNFSDESLDKNENDLQRINERIGNFEKEKENIVKAIAIGGKIESLITELKKREDDINKLIKSRISIEKELKDSKTESENVLINFSVRKMKDFFENNEIGFRRILIKSVVKSGTIKDMKITITLITGFSFELDLENIPEDILHLDGTKIDEYSPNVDLFYILLKASKLKKQ